MLLLVGSDVVLPRVCTSPLPPGRGFYSPERMARRTEQLPREVVRDLLAIARGLYSMRKAAGAAQAELAKLEQAGKHFALALELSETEPDTVGHRAAWSWAEQGLEALAAALAGDSVPVAEFVQAWGKRLKG